jgi:hypothetical protein
MQALLEEVRWKKQELEQLNIYACVYSGRSFQSTKTWKKLKLNASETPLNRLWVCVRVCVCVCVVCRVIGLSLLSLFLTLFF